MVRDGERCVRDGESSCERIVGHATNKDLIASLNSWHAFEKQRAVKRLVYNLTRLREIVRENSWTCHHRQFNYWTCLWEVKGCQKASLQLDTIASCISWANEHEHQPNITTMALVGQPAHTTGFAQPRYCSFSVFFHKRSVVRSRCTIARLMFQPKSSLFLAGGWVISTPNSSTHINLPTITLSIHLQ